jgi:two-component system, cell cycle response regulator DivK
MKSNILCIEDNTQNMRLISKFLKSFGYDMMGELDAQSGIETAIKDQPDLILMDINLPGMDGLEATRILQNDPRTAHIPIVALTANAMHGDRDHCIAAGCDEYLAKPVTRTELRNVLRHFLAASKSQVAVT